MTLPRLVSRMAAAAAAATLLAAAPALAAAQDSVSAVWVPKHVQFFYQGFTTHFSCDGLRDEIRGMLEKLGAKDLDVQEIGCIRMTGPTTFPGVNVRMRVLVPASSAAASNAETASPGVQAHWKNVVLLASNADPQDQGDCELIEQFKETFLPLFSTRKVEYGSNCVPHELTLGSHLSAEVLMPPPEVARSGGG